MPETVRIYEVGPRDGLQNEVGGRPYRDQGALPRAARRRGPARDRGDLVRVADGDPAARRRRRPDGRPRSAARRPLPGPRPERARHGPRRGRRRRRARRLHGGDRRVHPGQHPDDDQGIAGRLRAGAGARRRPRLVAARLRVDGLRLPVHRPRAPGGGGQGRRFGSSTSASTRSASATPSASACRARSRR